MPAWPSNPSMSSECTEWHRNVGPSSTMKTRKIRTRYQEEKSRKPSTDEVWWSSGGSDFDNFKHRSAEHAQFGGAPTWDGQDPDDSWWNAARLALENFFAPGRLSFKWQLLMIRCIPTIHKCYVSHTNYTNTICLYQFCKWLILTDIHSCILES